MKVAKITNLADDIKLNLAAADILIVAIGKPKMIDASYVKDGATVIDVGIHLSLIHI